MNIDQELYFAPGIPFSKVDWDGAGFPGQFKTRVTGFYLEPVEHCIQAGYAFAAGVLILTAMDALAKLKYPTDRVRNRNIEFARTELPSFSGEELATRLYEDFRNGLIHEGRIKAGGQFSLQSSSTVLMTKQCLLINPRFLREEFVQTVDRMVKGLEADVAARQQMADILKNDFAADVQTAAG